MEGKLYSGKKRELDVQAEKLMSCLVLLTWLSKRVTSILYHGCFEFVTGALQLNDRLYFHKLNCVTTFSHSSFWELKEYKILMPEMNFSEYVQEEGIVKY